MKGGPVDVGSVSPALDDNASGDNAVSNATYSLKPSALQAPVAKIDTLRAYMAAGDYRKALALAASWPRLGADKQDIERGHEAYARPDFQRQLRRDPEALIAAGIAALHRRYGA
jgi:hypothetical protein